MSDLTYTSKGGISIPWKTKEGKTVVFHIPVLARADNQLYRDWEREHNIKRKKRKEDRQKKRRERTIR